MRKLVSALAAAAMAFTVVAAGPSAESTPEGYQFEMELGKGDTGSYEGASDSGGVLLSSLTLGVLFEQHPNDCSADYVDERCDRGLLTAKAGGTVTVDFHGSFDPAADYDLAVHEWDGEAAGAEIASSGNGGSIENLEFKAKRGGEYVIVVYYFAAGGGYTLDVSVA